MTFSQPQNHFSLSYLPLKSTEDTQPPICAPPHHRESLARLVDDPEGDGGSLFFKPEK
jgi:hypothetical protein